MKERREGFFLNKYYRPSSFVSRPSKAGFTLIEVLVTVVIVTLGAMAVHQGFSRILHGLKATEDTLLGAQLVEKAAADLVISTWNSSSSIFNEIKAAPPEENFAFYSVSAAASQSFDKNLMNFSISVSSPMKRNYSSSVLLPKNKEAA